MQSAKIVFADADSVGAVNFSLLQQQGQLQLVDKLNFNAHSQDYLKDADVIISNKVQIEKNLLQQAPNLKLICVAATGYNNIDLSACQQQQVAVCNVTNYSTMAVAQHTFALLLTWLNKTRQYHTASTNGSWSHSKHFCLLDYPIADLAGKKLGIIGYGNIGQAVANIAKAFGMQVLIADRLDTQPREGRAAFAQVVEQSDILSLHCPLTKENEQFINAHLLQQMKSTAILINTARGGLIDENALLQALEQQQIQAALLDGLTVEPPAANHPLLNANLTNLLITPHVAWASIDSRQKLVDEIALNIQAFFKGELRNRLD